MGEAAFIWLLLAGLCFFQFLLFEQNLKPGEGLFASFHKLAPFCKDPSPERGHNEFDNGTLCDECRAIIQHARRMEISFETVEIQHKSGRFPNGSLGLVIDVTHLRNYEHTIDRIGNRQFICSTIYKGKSVNESDIIQEITRDMVRRRIHERYNLRKEPKARKRQCKQSHKPSKLLCIVYTTVSGHAFKIPTIRETWGPQCDGFFVASTATDLSIDAVDIPHDGPEEYNNIWQKIRAIWSYVYHHYYNDFDWFHIGGDDVWLIVDNLRDYLDSSEIRLAANYSESTNQQTPLFLGGRIFNMFGIKKFNSGGPGYTLNKASLKLLATHMPMYYQNVATSAEDVLVSRILDELGVDLYPTEDQEKRTRYNFYPPGVFGQMAKGPASPSSVAFHYIGKYPRKLGNHQVHMSRLHAILYDLCGTADFNATDRMPNNEMPVEAEEDYPHEEKMVFDFLR